MEQNHLLGVKDEIEKELVDHILPFWKTHVVDEYGDGFHGYMFFDLSIDKESDKICILYSKILWSFSAAYRMYNHEDDVKVAERAYDYMIEHFLDKEYGGFYWSLDEDNGLAKDTHKHMYNQAFALYGITEFFKVTGNGDVLNLAKELFRVMEKHGADKKNGGYYESFTRDWEQDGDLRLRENDLHVAKTMKTHLLILQAYLNLYSVMEDEVVEDKLKALFDLLLEKGMNNETGHVTLFFDEKWGQESSRVVYGRDMEFSWIMTAAAQALDCEKRVEKMKNVTMSIVDTCIEEGIEDDGSLVHESVNGEVLDGARVWWVQSEAMVAFLNAYEVTGEEKYLTHFNNSWDYIRDYYVDPKHGEWYWQLTRDNEIDTSKPIVEPWKGPDHNSRACMEVIERVSRIVH
ncbi:AGE family epimerase/isomerase [Evansella tamaricis]|uniref:Cellobiose 2-epimerase n=1 Tax=Evansella tamaricis TaxID=2069301 RepID=A0ABS6JHC4_9BACI|nr:AGE family epimerase/isomerase [Evansella tamaricis]MBU9712800.1 AGE family epimerase/isomerase [Evansella tamaricis]